MIQQNKMTNFPPLALSDQDIYDAMKKIPGYLDITPGDFKSLYLIVYQQAMQKIVESVKASDIMTRDVVTAAPSMPLQDAADLLATQKVSGVPVVNDRNQVVGVLSERDILTRMAGSEEHSFMDVVAHCLKGKGCAARAIRDQHVLDVMTSPAVTIPITANLQEILALLKGKKINRVPVVDAQGLLAGIVSREDIVHNSLIGDFS